MGVADEDAGERLVGVSRALIEGNVAQLENTFYYAPDLVDLGL